MKIKRKDRIVVLVIIVMLVLVFYTIKLIKDKNADYETEQRVTYERKIEELKKDNLDIDNEINKYDESRYKILEQDVIKFIDIARAPRNYNGMKEFYENVKPLVSEKMLKETFQNIDMSEKFNENVDTYYENYDIYYDVYDNDSNRVHVIGTADKYEINKDTKEKTGSVRKRQFIMDFVYDDTNKKWLADKNYEYGEGNYLSEEVIY